MPWKLPSTPLVRGLLGAVAFLTVITIVGLVALWPRGDAGISFGQTGQATRAATIVQTGAPCTTIPVQPCQRLTARIEDGPEKGQTTSFDFTETIDVDVGDRVRLVPSGLPEGSLTPGGPPTDRFGFSDFERRMPMLWLAIVFALIIIATTRLRGVRALGALLFSLAIVVAFVVPSIIRGNEPLLVALVGALAITLVTIPVAYGIGVKSLSAVIGTGTSLLITVLLAQAATSFTHLTGRASEEALFLRAASSELSIVGLLIAGMVIGLAGLVGEMVWSADKGKLKEMEVISMTTSAKIAIEGAVETALGTVAGQVIGAELEKRGDKTVWNVKILSTEEAIMAVYIDAVSGSVLMTEVKVAERRPVQESTL